MGRGVNFLPSASTCILQTGPKLPFLPKLALDIHISELENAIDLKFLPVFGMFGIDNTSISENVECRE